MHLRAFLFLVLLSCGSSDAGGSDATKATNGTTPVPVSSAPLQGTVGGNPFAGKVALAHYSVKSAVAEILVFDTQRTCADYFELRDGWRVQVAVRWQARVAGSIGDLAQLGLVHRFAHRA